MASEMVLEIILKTEDIGGFELYLWEKECARATIRKYLTDIHTFYRFLGEELHINKERIVDYKEWLVTRYAASSVNSMLAALNQFLEYLDAGKLKVRQLKIQRKMFQDEERKLTKEEYLRLISTAREQGNEQLALMMETICSTGIRVSELEYFTVSGVKSGKVNAWNKGKYRTVVLPGELQKRLLYYISKKKITSGPIFCTRNGKPIHRSNIWRSMKRLAKETGIDSAKIFPHNLRHLFARTYYQLTKNLVNLADILGHGNLEVTRIYTSDGLNEWKRSIERLDLIGKTNGNEASTSWI